MILELSGEIGIDPGPYSLRELRFIAEGSWWKAAKIEAAIRDFATPRKDKRNWEAKAFNPYIETKRRSITAIDLHGLKPLASKVTKVLATEVKVKNDA